LDKGKQLAISLSSDSSKASSIQSRLPLVQPEDNERKITFDDMHPEMSRVEGKKSVDPTYLSTWFLFQREVDKGRLLQTKNIISDFILLFDDTFTLTFEAYFWDNRHDIIFEKLFIYHAIMMFWEIQVFDDVACSYWLFFYIFYDVDICMIFD
jgi:hypothetical protein